jgi:transcriptional regulator with XRE-family HTH domain
MTFDPDAVSRELVRALRGSRSQAAVARRLRYRSNVAYLWESGRRYPTLASVLWLAHRTGVDVPEALDRFQKTRSREHDPWTVPGAAALLQDVQGQHSAAELARQLGLSRHTVGRWFRGETEPRLPAALALLELCTRRSLDFVSVFVDPLKLPSAADAWARVTAARTLVLEQPWSAAVLLSVELERYRAHESHPEGWIAEKLGIPVETEALCVRLLVDSGQLALVEGLYVPTGASTMDVATRGRALDLRRHWAQVNVDRTRRGPGCSGAWNLFTVSDEDFVRIKTLQREYFRALRSVVAETSSMDRLVLANMQVVVLDDEE